MSSWPLDVTYDGQNPVSLLIHGDPVTLTPLDATTLEFAVEDDADPKLVGVSDASSIVRLVPSVGPNPLLVFPQRSLLCPANSKLKTVIELPLFVQIGVGTPRDVREIAQLKAPTTSRALYGPVDAGVLCTSVRSNVGVSIDDLLRSRPGQESSLVSTSDGDEPEISPKSEGAVRVSSDELTAYASLTISNRTAEPREVGKVMIPQDLLGLFEADGLIRTSHLKMQLLGEQEAELDFGTCPDPEARPIADLHGRERTTDGRKHLFDLSYRNKTGLEYGF